jgi:cyclopropane fatty-acyl-phospholipid synthase-like methyltransferase
MVEGYNGGELIKALKKHLEKGATVLELGMGPGKDLEILSESFNVTGSDNSQIFLDLYKKKNKDANLVLLDAISIDIDRNFDCIYSNKVLQHLARKELKESFRRQKEILKVDGILFHSFWYGNKEEEINNLRFVYYTEDTIEELLDDDLELLDLVIYNEIERDDSFYIILKRTR